MNSSFVPDTPPDPSGPEPDNLRLLRRLVTLLMAVMIVGFLLIVVMFVIRLNSGAPGMADPGTLPLTTLPDVIALPDDVKALSFTVAPDWYAVVTDDNRILIFNRADGTLRQSVRIAPAR